MNTASAQVAKPAATVKLLIDGQFVESKTTEWQDVVNPATQEVLARVPFATDAEIEAAIASAKRAYKSWKNTPLAARARIMLKLQALVREHMPRIAKTLSAEQGKTLPDAEGDVFRGLEVVEHACSIGTLQLGEFAENVANGVDTYTIRQPIGVCVGITPFNFPAMVPLWMLPVAIACGNTFILKPSEKVPLTATRLVELLAETGLPAGVVSLVHGTAPQVEQLIDHPQVAAVSIVGSTGAASAVYARAAARGKRVQALGGAKNHMVVMPDADLDAVVESVMSSAFGSTGQRCMAGSVAVAVDPIGDEFVARLRARAGAMQIGPGDQAGVEMGPLINAAQRDRVLSYLQAGVEERAELVLDGRQRSVPHDGFFVGASIFDRVNPDMRIAREEIFGPVLSVIRAKSLADAVAVVNHSAMGNGASIFTRSGAAARQFTSDVEAGMVGVNIGVPVPMAFFSFSGWKGSFFGDLHVHGKDGVRFYTEVKVVTSRFV
ncbi:MAG: CoA-acylating methylmalonate-semialdehyde dehydrogenase [Gammaproteobacteria bacterium]|nr:CoA-acylating methylmalonate-semialdehyde dehydrogenase [Gammaproteobacteria bacterium]